MNRFFKAVERAVPVGCAGGFVYFFALGFGQINLASVANASLMMMAGGLFANALINDRMRPEIFKFFLGLFSFIVTAFVFFLLPSYIELDPTAMFILISLIGFAIGVIQRRAGWLFDSPYN